MKKKFFVLLFFMITLANFAQTNNSCSTLEVNNEWKFTQAQENQWYPAKVPGNVHSDLLMNGLIPDPYFGLNEKDLQWIGEKDWIYKTEFSIDKTILQKENIEIEFKGLDTYADVFLNDVKILSADNMFREWRVECKSLLKEGINTLSINFRSVFGENLPKYKSAPYLLQSFGNNDQADIKINMYSRKAGFHFGWDWGPRLITCGIHKPIVIMAWDKIKLNTVQVIQKNVSAKNAQINSNLEVESSCTQDASIKALVDGKVSASKNVLLEKGTNKLSLNFDMENPHLWWTNGLGEQPLYSFEYVVTSQSNISDSKKYKIGIRSVEVVREKDSIGTSFYFKLNGIPIFAKGVNYIPQDNLQNRVTLERYKHIIKSAADANMNILRIWGGGIYEDDLFYDLCDEYGILVWQDLMFACGMYPSDEHYLDNVKNEVMDNARRLRNHACLAMYCGNNENEVSWYSWGWKEIYSEEIQKQYETGFKKLFYDIIPSALNQADGTRYYHPSSPCTGYNNIPITEGDAHYWSVWHGKEPFETYNDNVARFMSEYGFQSYPEISTIKKFAKPEDMQLHSEVMLSHQRCMADERKDKEYGNRLIQTYMDRQFKEPKDFESYVYVSQMLQAEGVRLAVEAHRRNMPKCMGTMYWQINDCWPVASWSSIDYYGNWKALHYYIKKFYEPIIIAPQERNDNICFDIISDKLTETELDLSIKVLDFTGKEIYSKKIPVNVVANKSKCYISIPKDDLINEQDEEQLVIVSQLSNGSDPVTENKFYFTKEKDLALEKPEIRTNIVKSTDGYSIELSADKLAKDVYLNTDETGFFSDNYFDLIPGMTKTLEFKTEKSIDNFISKIKIISLIDSY